MARANVSEGHAPSPKPWASGRWPVVLLWVSIVAATVGTVAIAFSGSLLFFVADDAYYLLGVARNIALEKGLTLDGINPTNGFQPLYPFLAWPLYVVWPDALVSPIRAAVLALAVFQVGGAVLLYRLVSYVANPGCGAIAVFLWLFNLNANPAFAPLSGMETPLYIMLVLGAAYYYLRYWRPTARPTYKSTLVLALLLATATYARIDSLFLGIAVAIDMALNHVRRRDWRQLAPHLCLLGGGFAALYLPWLAWNYLTFGTVDQSSGLFWRFFGQEQANVAPEPSLAYATFVWRRVVLAFLQVASSIVVPDFYFNLLRQRLLVAFGQGTGGLAITLVVVAVVLITWRAGVSNKWSRALDKYLPDRRFGDTGFLAVYSLLLVFYYSSIQMLYSLRHLAAAQALFSIVGAVVLYILAKGLANLTIARMLPKRLLATLLLAGYFALWTAFLLSQALSEAAVRNPLGVLPELVRNNVPPGARVGIFNSGVVSYFLRDYTIVNLDGKANMSAMRALKERKLLDYLEETQIQYVADWTSRSFKDEMGGYGAYWGPGYIDRLELVATARHTGGDQAVVYRFIATVQKGATNSGGGQP